MDASLNLRIGIEKDDNQTFFKENMAVHSIGVDITDIDRIEGIIERLGQRFLKRVFTPAEISYCQQKAIPHQSFAARFATKEAVLKATGLGLVKGLSWQDIEVLNDENGRPSVQLYNKTARLLEGKKLHLSLSHSGNMAIAMVVVDSEKTA